MSLTTRSQANNRLVTLETIDEGLKQPMNSKRIAEDSPERLAAKKRSVFDDLTNNLKKQNAEALKNKKNAMAERKLTRRQNTNKIESDSEPSDGSTQNSQETGDIFTRSPIEESDSDLEVSGDDKEEVTLPEGVVDFDKSTEDDIYAEPYYAMDIFNYYKERELEMRTTKYMSRQGDLTKSMRAILSDWLVEVQESFELNHETLYLAVKIIDQYLMRVQVAKGQLQLLGATATFIACKFDERSPPLIDDFLYICDDAYTRKEMLEMEQKVLKTLKFDLGFPLSYRFLRRYARCAKVSMEVLTLARYILETSLMDYDLLSIRESRVAAACLYLALKMKKISEWTPQLEYYSGYKADELENLTLYLNNMIAQPVHKNLQTVRTKYSHKVFFEVATIPPLPYQPDVTL